MKDYSKCKICNKPLPPLLVKHAKSRFEQMICSGECQRKDIIKQFGCCEKAELTPCVCMYSFKCPVHGEKHIGTHD